MANSWYGSQTSYDLGGREICPGKSGAALLEAVQKTPFWHKKTKSQASHLQRMEPDRLAAVFLLLALDMSDPSPVLSRWFEPTATQETDGFGKKLARLAMDLAYYDPEASRNIENIAIEMLNQSPELVTKLRQLAFTPSSVFSAAFTAEICSKTVANEPDGEPRSALLVSLSCLLSDIGQNEKALEYVDTALVYFRRMVDVEPRTIWSNLAIALNNKANFLAKLGRDGEALEHAKEAVSLRRQLAAIDSTAHLPELAVSLSNFSNRLSALGNDTEAMNSVREAVGIFRQLAETEPDEFLYESSVTLTNLSN